MGYCTECGNETPASDRFCANCGHPAGSAPPDTVRLPAPPTLPPPPTAPPGAPPRGTPTLDWRPLVVGNWVGAAATALVALTLTGLLSCAMALVAKPADFGVDNTLTLAAVIAAGAFGADLVFDTESEGVTSDFSFGMYPLTVTVIVLVVAVVVFRRVVKSYISPYQALGDAARAAVIFGLGLMVPAIIFSADNDETGRGWGRALSDDEFGATDFKSYAPAAFFLGFLILFVVLALVVVMRSGWPQLGFRRVQAWVVAPLYGHATTFVLLPVAGLVAFLLLGFGEPSVTENDPTGDDLQALLTLVFGLLANGGVWVMSLGAGASVGSNTEATDEPDDAEWFHLWGQVTDDEPGLWAAPAIMLAILVASAFVVLRRSPPGHALRSLLIWVGSLLAFIPLLVRLSGAHFTGEASFLGEDYEFELYFGAHGVQTTFYLTGVALLVAMALAAMSGNLDLTKLRNDVGSALRSIQAAPGQTRSVSPPKPTGPPPAAPPVPPPPPPRPPTTPGADGGQSGT